MRPQFSEFDCPKIAKHLIEAAENWLWKAIHIKEKHGDETGVAKSYNQLGLVAKHREDFDAAEQWFLKSLEIKAKLNDEIGMAGTYRNLRDVAEERKQRGR